MAGRPACHDPKLDRRQRLWREPGCLVPDAANETPQALAGLGTGDLWEWAALAEALPAGTYRLADNDPGDAAALGWALAAYRFDRYKKTKDGLAHLVLSWSHIAGQFGGEVKVYSVA